MSHRQDSARRCYFGGWLAALDERSEIEVGRTALWNHVTLSGDLLSSNTEIVGGLPLNPSSCHRATTFS